MSAFADGRPSCSTSGGGGGGSNDDVNNINNRYRPYSRFEQRPEPPSFSRLKKVDNIDNKSDDQSNIVINEGKILLVGSVEHVVGWCRMLSFLDPTKIIYQVFGIIDSIKNGCHKCEKIFSLRCESKQSRIVCVFYEIDRKMPNILKGSLVLCTGHIKGKNKLQIFTLRELINENKNSFDRITLVSQWTINDILINNKI